MNRSVDSFLKMLFICAIGGALIWFGSTITPWLAWMFYLAGIIIVIGALAQWND